MPVVWKVLGERVIAFLLGALLLVAIGANGALVLTLTRQVVIGIPAPEAARPVAILGVELAAELVPEGGILAGHGRLLAARNLGLAEVPVIRFEHLSEAQKRAYLIADNQLALQAGWSEELLAAELAWLRDESFDLDLVGFDATELEQLLALADGQAGSDEGEEEVPEPPEEPVSKPGDLWVLGNHRLLCGDATVLTDVERVLGGQLADMTFCDPPYNVDYANSPKDKLRGKHRPILNDHLGGGFETFLLDACTNILAVTKGAVYVCMSSSELHTLQKAFAAAGGKWSTFVIWAKNTFTLGRADYQRQYEPILYGWKDGKAEIEAIEAGLKSRSDVIESEGYDAEEVDRRIAADHAREEGLGLRFGPGSDAGETPRRPASDPVDGEQNNTGTEENAA